MIRRRPSRRSGTATVEMVVVLGTVLVPVMVGIWELGRVVEVQQLVATAAREGARLAAQGVTVNADGSQTLIYTALSPAAPDNNSLATKRYPNVKGAVCQSLAGSGLSNLRWADVTVTFQYLDQPATLPGNPAAPPANDTTQQPYSGVKNQTLQVYVSVPYSKVNWTLLGIVNPTAVTYTAQWRMLVDDPFTVNTTLPTW